MARTKPAPPVTQWRIEWEWWNPTNEAWEPHHRIIDPQDDRTTSYLNDNPEDIAQFHIDHMRNHPHTYRNVRLGTRQLADNQYGWHMEGVA